MGMAGVPGTLPVPLELPPTYHTSQRIFKEAFKRKLLLLTPAKSLCSCLSV